MNNPVIDLIVRIKNAYQARRQVIESPYSRFREDVLKKLVELKYIKAYKVSGEKIKKLSIELLYHENEFPLADLKIYSTPGRRWYMKAKEMKSLKNSLGDAILSTPQGILTVKEAKKAGVGGELLFEIW